MASSKIKVIGLSGKMGSGKSTAAAYLATKLNYAIFAFADPLKQTVQQLTDAPASSLWGPSESRTPAVRELLQVIGTDLVRKYYPDRWVTLMRRRIGTYEACTYDIHQMTNAYHLRDTKGIIIPDVRFKNELSYLNTINATTIRIVGKNNTVDKNNTAEAHESEVNLDSIQDASFTTVIHNDGTLETLHKKLDQIIKEI